MRSKGGTELLLLPSYKLESVALAFDLPLCRFWRLLKINVAAIWVRIPEYQQLIALSANASQMDLVLRERCCRVRYFGHAAFGKWVHERATVSLSGAPVSPTCAVCGRSQGGSSPSVHLSPPKKYLRHLIRAPFEAHRGPFARPTRLVAQL
jgi:hypothetical protein